MAKTVPTGLHSPITNTPPTESVVSETLVSEGSTGSGETLDVKPDAETESVPRGMITESAVMDSFPDMTELLDIGIASFGGGPDGKSQLEVVIGSDERVNITETSKYPWRVIASLLITAADNSQWIGTGWFISPRTLVTAGHCVYIKRGNRPGRDGWVKKIQVIPGRNGSTMPYGAMTATEFWTVKGWGEQGLENYDYASIILPTPFSQDIGYYGYGVYTDAKLKTKVANVAGYPGDKPSSTLWYDSRKVSKVTVDKVYYEADTYGGQSGTVVYVMDKGKRIGVAIHAYGDSSANSGTRISSQVFANLELWKET